MSPGVSKLRASSLAAFHLVGDRSGLSTDAAKSWSFRPALFANYRDLKRLRYDFPLILGSGDTQDWVRSLADSTDLALQKSAAEGIDGEETRRQVLNLEQEIRHLVSEKQSGSLSSLWQSASQALVNDSTDKDQAEKLAANLDKAYAQLNFDGEVIDCDAHLPARLIRHAWKQSQQVKASRLHKRIERLLHKLSDILQLEFLHSDEAHNAAQLESSLGVKNHNVFDFEVMAGILKSVPVGDPLPGKRQQRIKAAIKVLQSQGFVAASAAGTPFEFDFEDCNKALETFRQRLPAMAELVKAISIAELEIENRYAESRHDEFYSDFDEDHLGAEDLALFPSYLVLVEQADTAANTQAMLAPVCRSRLLHGQIISPVIWQPLRVNCHSAYRVSNSRVWPWGWAMCLCCSRLHPPCINYAVPSCRACPVTGLPSTACIQACRMTCPRTWWRLRRQSRGPSRSLFMTRPTEWIWLPIFTFTAIRIVRMTGVGIAFVMKMMNTTPGLRKLLLP
jgi:hypothetical protein